MGARGRRGGDREENVWTPVTKLGRLVKDGKISSLEEIFLFSLPVKEAEIIDYFLKDKIQDEVMKIMPVQKQSSAGQRTRFKAFVALGDTSGHIGLGVKCASCGYSNSRCYYCCKTQCFTCPPWILGA